MSVETLKHRIHGGISSERQHTTTPGGRQAADREARGAGNSNDAISWNTVLNFNNGILLDSATYDTVSKNTIRESETDGIQLTDHSMYDTVADNLADGNSVGILLLTSNSNAISHNTTDSNLNDGIVVAASNNDSISRNTANSNTPQAIGILIFGDSNTVSGNTADYNWLGIVSTMSTNTTISHNTANDNESDGIEVQYDVNASGEKDTVFGNTANGNLNGGISLLLSTYVTVSHNVANNNMIFGIQVQNSSEAKTYDTISVNTASNNLTGDGINLINDDSTTVSRNTASHDGIDGIALQTSSNNAVSDNTANNDVNDGIDVDVASLANTFTTNTAKNNGNWNLQDASMGSGTAGTANAWSKNKANSSSPSGLS